MSGIMVGSRLEQLERLRVRLDQEIAEERHAVAIGIRRQTQPERRLHVVRQDDEPRPEPEALDHAHLALALVHVPLAMVSPRAIRNWARDNGYALDIKGPLPTEAKAAFVEAHR